MLPQLTNPSALNSSLLAPSGSAGMPFLISRPTPAGKLHHVIDRARKRHSHGARRGPMRVGITAPDQAQKTIEKHPQTASLRWDQSTV
jgi:hypothetical protein